MEPKKVFVISLGCAKNRVDTEVALGRLIHKGYKITSDLSEANYVLINTCSFIEEARKEAIEEIVTILEEKKKDPRKKVIVTGCLLSHKKVEVMKALPEVDLFVGLSKIGEIDRLIEEKEEGNLTSEEELIKEGDKYIGDRFKDRLITTGPGWAYVKIADGCSRKCSFCTIPFIKGKFCSRPPEKIKEEVKRLADLGIKEINLVSQDTTAYGKDIGIELLTLLKELEKIKGIEWIRILYMYPDSITDKLLSFISESEKILPYFDIPFQHIDTNILRLMRRGYSERDIWRLIEKIKKRSYRVEPVIRTTLIVGFPGEGEEEFKKLENFLIKAELNYVGLFKYSDEPDTPSYFLSGKVSSKKKYCRYRRLLSLQRKISKKLLKKLKNTYLKVLIEGETEIDMKDGTILRGPILYGRYYGQAPEVDGISYVIVKRANEEIEKTQKKPPFGQILYTKIFKTDDYDIVGWLVNGGFKS